MARRRGVLVAMLLGGCGGAAPAPTAPSPVVEDPAAPAAVEAPRYTLVLDDADRDLEAALRGDVEAGIARIEEFFGAPFARPFTVAVAADRAALDAHWGARWHRPDLRTECWMVGMGMGDELSLLSPARWGDQACEHDPVDAAARASLIAHELVHTYHAQRNPALDTDDDGEGFAALAWLVEGVATYVSSQLDDGHLASARQVLDAGAGPTSLAEAHAGRYRYGVSGSLVAYVDATWSRAAVVDLLAVRSPDEVLARLGVDEATLLEGWRAWVTR
ncbi:MAG: hypothetical protein KC464_15980 [Myxococcales bacterium]|nr:hypothetical protein [Myxococcales bacterium]